MKTIILDVHGMSCQHCVRTVQKTLSVIEGVSSVEVTLKPGKAIVVCENVVTGQRLAHALEEETDYTAEVNEEKIS